MPHQIDAVAFFRERGGRALFYHDPGVGKTFAACEVIRRCLHANGLKIINAITNDKPDPTIHLPRFLSASILIICPASLVAQWKVEMARYLSPEEMACTQVINYEKLAIEKYGKPLVADEYLLIVADECQKIISPTAKTTKVFKKLKTKYKLALSGTPAPNAEWELWSLLDWFAPGVMGDNFYKFKQQHCNLHPMFHTILGLRAPERFRKIVAQFVHRVHKEDVLHDLPERHTSTVYVTCSDAHRKAYDAMRETLLAEVNGEKITISNALALISYLRKAVDCPVEVGIALESPKLKAVHICLEYDAQPTIVFVEHKATARAVAHMIESSDVLNMNSAIITSDTSLKERAAICSAFQNGEIDVLIGTSALATGLNLQRCTRVIHMSYPWNGSRIDQRVARAWRHGQEHEVEEIFICCKDTIDTKIAGLIASKRKIEGRYTRQELISIL